MTGTGTIVNPWDFQTAIANDAITGGDTLLLRGGAYTGDFIGAVRGTEAKHIIIKAYPGERPLIDGSLDLTDSPYVDLYDIDFTDSRLDRKAVVTPGISINGSNNVYGCIVANLHHSGVDWFGSGAGEVCENIFVDNGYIRADDIYTGYGIYTHNNLGGTRLIARNAFSDQQGQYSLHIYGGSNALRDFLVKQNAFHGDAIHCGGGLGLFNFVYEDNVQFGDLMQYGLYSEAPGQDATFRRNTWIDTVNINIQNIETVVEEDNVVYQAASFYPWPRPTGYTVYSHAQKPQYLSWLVPFTKSARWAGMVVIYSRDGEASVPVDISSLVGVGPYRWRNTQNPAEVLDFEYAGGVINVPTAWHSSTAIGSDTPAYNFWPGFGSLFIERV